MIEGTWLKVIKYLVFAVNFIFVLAGLVLVVFGGVVSTRFKLDFLQLFLPNISGVVVAFIVAGSLIFVVAFFGCCGALKENACMVNTFSILLATIVVMQAAAAIAGVVMGAKVEEAAGNTMMGSIEHYNANETSTSTNKAWDNMQTNTHCCGVYNYSDWRKNDWYRNNDLPDSCCVNVTKSCGKSLQIQPTKINKKSCLSSVTDLLDRNLAIVIGIAGAVAVLELLGIVFSIFLARGIRSGYNKVEED